MLSCRALSPGSPISNPPRIWSSSGPPDFCIPFHCRLEQCTSHNHTIRTTIREQSTKHDVNAAHTLRCSLENRSPDHYIYVQINPITKATLKSIILVAYPCSTPLSRGTLSPLMRLCPDLWSQLRWTDGQHVLFKHRPVQLYLHEIYRLPPYLQATHTLTYSHIYALTDATLQWNVKQRSAHTPWQNKCFCRVFIASAVYPCRSASGRINAQPESHRSSIKNVRIAGIVKRIASSIWPHSWRNRAMNNVIYVDILMRLAARTFDIINRYCYTKLKMRRIVGFRGQAI